MDTRKFGSVFIKPDDVRDGPRQERIVNVFESEKYRGLVLDLDAGDQFSLNNTNTRILNKAYGCESDNWIGQIIELALGTYKDWRSDPPEEKETVIVKPISAPQPSAENGGIKTTTAEPRLVRPLDDEIGF